MWGLLAAAMVLNTPRVADDNMDDVEWLLACYSPDEVGYYCNADQTACWWECDRANVEPDEDCEQ